MKVVTALALLVAMTTPAAASQLLQVTEETDNGDGTITWWFTIDSLPEVSFLEMTISGQLQQVDGGATYEAVSSSPWAPSVVFTSDATLASALNPEYSDSAHLDTVDRRYALARQSGRRPGAEYG